MSSGWRRKILVAPLSLIAVHLSGNPIAANPSSDPSRRAEGILAYVSLSERPSASRRYTPGLTPTKIENTRVKWL
jgi:hypothetical protein